MKENKYDDAKFFDKYSKMTRSVNGLEGAGEWHALKKLLPSLKDKRVRTSCFYCLWNAGLVL